MNNLDYFANKMECFGEEGYKITNISVGINKSFPGSKEKLQFTLGELVDLVKENFGDIDLHDIKVTCRGFADKDYEVLELTKESHAAIEL